MLDGELLTLGNGLDLTDFSTKGQQNIQGDLQTAVDVPLYLTIGNERKPKKI